MVQSSINPLPVSFFVQNRKRLFAEITDPFVAVLASGRAVHKSSDENHAFWANRNTYYLSGLEQEGIILLLDNLGGREQAQLFIQAPDPMHERWQGHLLTRDEALAKSRIEEIHYLDDFDQILDDLSGRAFNLWLDHSASDPQSVSLGRDLPERIKAGAKNSCDLSPILTKLRMIKSEDEIRLIKEAAVLTGLGIEAMAEIIRPGLMEYHLWAEFSLVLARAGVLETSFPSIIASGKNVFCLHYKDPFMPIHAGDLVQLDVGARLHNLPADISRVLPADGRFSERQLLVYETVRRCQDTAFSLIRPGITLTDINEACRQTAKEHLLAAGLITPETDAGDFFWHNVSHHLGLDVHDVSDRKAGLEPGMVLTVEPGVYLPEHGIGIRLEDDVLVSAQGCEILSTSIPREAAQIEALIQG